MKELTGIFKDLKFGDLFLLENGEIVRFAIHSSFCLTDKRQLYENTKTILNLGYFYITGTGYKIWFSKRNGKCIRYEDEYGKMIIKPNNYNIVKKFEFPSITFDIYNIMFDDISSVPRKEDIAKIRKLLKYFFQKISSYYVYKQHIDNLDDKLKHEINYLNSTSKEIENKKDK